ncbi:CHAT domain protein [Ceratobasidium sp. AG-Ba]|nr:CHAT domain protein [Ceratobasidium sp. AG-Ba]
MTPEGHPNQARYQNTLGKLHFLLYEITDQSEDAYKSCDFFKSAALSPNGHPSVRLEASTLWAPQPMNEASNVLQAYGYCMELLPKAVWMGTTIHRRYECLTSDIQGAAEDAIMVAIVMGHYDLALEWLEQGRCLVWSQMLQLRAPVDSLGVLHPEVAQEFKSLSHWLENISSVEFERHSTLDNHDGNLVRDITCIYSQLAHQRDQLIENIRLLPSFEDFLRPPRASKLISHVRRGVAVVVQVHMLRCDAIIIDSNTHTIAHVPLASFSLEKADDLRDQISMCLQMRGIARGFKKSDRRGKSLKDLLATLWSDIVEPVLDRLDISQVLPVDRLPRITWCVTGPLSFLPIHAAGIYDKPNKILSNLAISSYIPNLSSMGRSELTSPDFSGVLAVGHQSSIHSFEPLPGTKKELDILEEKLVGKKFTRLDEGAATTKAVLEAMSDHSWVHFACHGSQDPKDPQKSAFHLHDDDLDLATISRHPIKNAKLAILSACQTAAGDSALPNEAVHLAAGLLMAGYSNVVATMWSISDEDAPIVTRKLYECLLEDGVPDSRKSAKALHVAVKHLQDTIGVENFTRWVPYVHMGG